MRSFREDLEESNQPRIRLEWERVIESYFGLDATITWTDDKTAQQGFGADVLVQTKKGRKYSIDVKTRRNAYQDKNMWPIEIVHHRYSDVDKTKHIEAKEGWLYCSTADYILFGTLDESRNKIVEAIGFSLKPFKDIKFKSMFKDLKNAWADTLFDTGQYQLTLNKLLTDEFLAEHADDYLGIKRWYE